MTNVFKSVSEALRRRRNINNTIAELYRLTDQELHDIGIHRSNIDVVARGLIDIHRAVRDANAGETGEQTND